MSLRVHRAVRNQVITAGIPSSATWLTKATDTRFSDFPGHGGDAGYVKMDVMNDGDMITFGISHTSYENNAISTYNPPNDRWTNRIPHTNATWNPDEDVTGRTYLGNRDNQLQCFARGGINKFFVFQGQRGWDMVGNFSGVVDKATWKWESISDTGALPFVEGGGGDFALWDGTCEFIDALSTMVLFSGRFGNTDDTLVILHYTGTQPTPWQNFNYPSGFTGSQKLFYVSNSSWVRGNEIHIYGGTILNAQGNVAVNNTMWRLNVVNPLNPIMTSVSVNSLAPSLQCVGQGMIGRYAPYLDMAVITTGDNIVNLYDYGGVTGASPNWYSIPVTNGPVGSNNGNRNYPNISGTGYQGQWSALVNQLIMQGQNGSMFGLQLNP